MFTINKLLNLTGLYRRYHNKFFSNFTKSNNEIVNKQIFEICKKIEPREVRHKELYNEYLNNVTYCPDMKNIDVSNLANKYNMTTYYMLVYLFNEGLLSNHNNNLINSNIFNL